MTSPDPTKLAQLFEKFPLLYPTLTKLNQHNIAWMIGGSGCLFLFGNERPPGDVDILIRNSQHDVVDEIFKIKSFTYSSPTENVRNSNPEGNHDIQFTSHLELSIESQKYSFDYGAPAIQQKVSEVTFHDQIVRIAPPEEALLVKALLQRGEAEEKHDVEDIQNFLELYDSLDRNYLESRITRLNAQDRTAGIFLWLR